MLSYDIASIVIADNLLEEFNPIAMLHWDWVGMCVGNWLATF